MWQKESEATMAAISKQKAQLLGTDLRGVTMEELVQLHECATKGCNRIFKRLSEMAEEETLCIVCMDRQRRTLFGPCNHLLCCNQCSLDLLRCPVCSLAIEQKTQVLM